MPHIFKRFLLCTISIWITACTQQPTDFTYIDTAEREVVTAWLAGQPNLRIATDDDCECEEDLKELRKEKDGVGYHPYYARGDFNGDGVFDFAVVVIRKDDKSKAKKKYNLLAIFNGPYQAGTQPAYTTELLGAVFFKPQNPVPHRLLVGAFFSEGTFLVPKGNTYMPDEEEDE